MVTTRIIARILLSVTASMTMGEFMELQKLSVDDLRARFGLKSSCEPAVTALATDPALNRVTVAIECRPKPAGTPPASAPGHKPGSAAPGRKTS